jgi:hypothetical protein
MVMVRVRVKVRVMVGVRVRGRVRIVVRLRTAYFADEKQWSHHSSSGYATYHYWCSRNKKTETIIAEAAAFVKV